jgi:hypothetical protein
MPGPLPRNGVRALTAAERMRAYRERRKAEADTKGGPAVRIRYRRPTDRRGKSQRWADAVQELADLIDSYQDWKDNLPASLADSALADRLDEVLALRDAVDQLAAAELPKGFGRD